MILIFSGLREVLRPTPLCCLVRICLSFRHKQPCLIKRFNVILIAITTSTNVSSPTRPTLYDGGGYPPLDVLRPPGGAPLHLARFRPRGESKGSDY
jgi:hypothetical protein